MMPSIDSELWLLEQLRNRRAPIGDPFDGASEPDHRREQFRAAIIAKNLQRVLTPYRPGVKRMETFAEVFQRLYGEPLDLTSNTQGK